MLVLLTFCDIPWWLTWLLPFLLGLGLGYLLWAQYKSKVANLESQINDLSNQRLSVENSLEICKKARNDAEGNLAILKGKLREIELANAGLATDVSHSTAIVIEKPLTLQSAKIKVEPNDDNWYAAIGNNKFQIIEGIGPKMEEVLNENEISTFLALANVNKDSLRQILNKYGDKYRMIDPNTWPHQATLADNKKWQELIDLQKNLVSGRSDTNSISETESKLEKWLIKNGVIRRWAQDDLKAVEGIGPKIEQLLHNAGIHTWQQLSETSVAAIQDILAAAGPRFALAEPSTWPEQARLAALGLWDDLQQYQDFLIAGKVKK
jgi:predicted flap endonuclease-1-like 5' DNA nuclease